MPDQPADVRTCPECKGGEVQWQRCFITCPLCHGTGLVRVTPYQPKEEQE